MTWITKACTPTLPPTEVNDLCRRFASGDDDALQLLVSSHVAFVTSVAQRYSALGVPLEDLVSEGILGLIEAARRFDTERGNRFLTYAVFWIRRQILDSLRRDSQPIRRPRNAPKVASYAVPQRTAQAPRAVSMQDATCRNAPDSPLYFQSLDQGVSGGDASGLSDALEDTAAACPEDGVLRDDARRVIWCALDRLRPKQRLVVALRHGLCDDQRWTLRQVGELIGVSRERVRQIELQAMDQLRRGVRQVIAPPVRPQSAPKTLQPLSRSAARQRGAWPVRRSRGAQPTVAGMARQGSSESPAQPSRRTA